MILTEEMIKKLPIITEEQLHNEYWNADEFVTEGLRQFDEAIKEIDRLDEKLYCGAFAQ